MASIRPSSRGHQRLGPALSFVPVLVLAAGCERPTDTRAGEAISPVTVVVKDEDGNVIPGQEIIASLLGDGTLNSVSGNLTLVSNASGIVSANPNITVDMSVVNANDLSTVTQTRLNANDVDVVDMFGFANAAQPYMSNVTAPNWQTLIDAGLLLDISDQPFLENYDASAIQDAGTYDDKVYQINLGRVSYSGIYYNKDLFAANNVEVPTTWDELVAACETFNAADIPCMTAGGKDGWPIFVGNGTSCSLRMRP